MSDAMWSDANSKYFVAHVTPDNVAQGSAEPPSVYGLALLLVASANGYASYSPSACGGSYNCPANWQPDYDTALPQLGPASGAMQIRTDSGGHRFYERDFTNGVVAANPSANSILSFTPTPGGL
jgi:hypothetical protein